MKRSSPLDPDSEPTQSLDVRSPSSEEKLGVEDVIFQQAPVQTPPARRIVPIDQISLNYLIQGLLKHQASDLHLKPGRPPLYRVQGQLAPAHLPSLPKGFIETLVQGLLNEKQWRDLEEKKNIDFSFQISRLGRYRCNAYYQKGGLALAIRGTPTLAPVLDQLGLPSDLVKRMCQKTQGLLLVTGPTGSGKSTTLAAIVEYLNQKTAQHILTLEDPIEFVFQDARASISQREVGADALSFHEGLKAGLRQDPDVIVIGEMRDQETIQAALTASETGHLVISTLHTNDALGSIERILDLFSADAQSQIRLQLATNLVGVIAQKLIPAQEGKGRVLACEILNNSPIVENYIAHNEIKKIPEIMSRSSSQDRMMTFNQSLRFLITRGLISLENGLRHSSSPDDLQMLLAGVEREEGY